MTIEFDDEIDRRQIRPGEFEKVAVFRDSETGEDFRLNLEQVNRILSGDMNFIPGAERLPVDMLRAGRSALALSGPRNE